MKSNSKLNPHARFGVMGLALLLITALPPQARALSPQAADFLRSIGLDPNSDEVRSADADGKISVIFHGDPKVFSLEGLAAERLTNAVKEFVYMRGIIRRLKADYANTKIPMSKLHNANYLNPEERTLLLRAIKEGK